MTHRLPIYLALDMSGGMKGDVLGSLKEGLSGFIQDQNGDPWMLENAWISIITFGSEPTQLVPLTELTRFQMPDLHANGTCCMGAAFEVLAESIRRDVVKNTPERKGDRRPILLLVTQGLPTDDIRQGLEELTAIRFAQVGCCALGSDADLDVLEFVANRISIHGSQPYSRLSLPMARACIRFSNGLSRVNTPPVDMTERMSSRSHSIRFLRLHQRSSFSNPPKNSKGQKMSRRLPVYLVLDTSGSMTGEAIESVNYGIGTLVQALRSDPYALETAWLSIITFDSSARQIVPLTELTQFQIPTLSANGMTVMGEAFDVLAECIHREVVKNTPERKGDWKPMVFLMTDGIPSDDVRHGLDALRSAKPGVVVCCAAGMEADVDVLSHIAEHSTSSSNPDAKLVVRLANADQKSFGALFKWISSSISQGSQKIDQGIQYGAPDLPPPPPEINVVL